MSSDALEFFRWWISTMIRMANDQEFSVNRSHFTKPAEAGTVHYWTVGDHLQAVTLDALHFQHAPTGPLADLAAQHGLAATDGATGTWLFNVIREHRHNPGSGWSCPRHGDACDMDAFMSSLAGPVWQRITEAGVTDDVVYAELERVHAAVFQSTT